MSEGDKLRLFVAFDVPRLLLDEIARASAPLREKWPAARWTPIDNQHVTLKFLGWVPSESLDGIVSALEDAVGHHEPVRLRLDRFGTFPSPRRAWVLWVGFVDEAERLAPLAGGLESAFVALGFEPEARRFTPHVTLARFKQPERVPPEIGEEPRLEGSFTVGRIVLYRSHLSPKGPRYEVIASFALGPDRGGAEA